MEQQPALAAAKRKVSIAFAPTPATTSPTRTTSPTGAALHPQPSSNNVQTGARFDRRSSMMVPGVHNGNDFLATDDERDAPNRRGALNAVSLLRHLGQDAVMALGRTWGTQRLTRREFVTKLIPLVLDAGFFSANGARCESAWEREGWLAHSTVRATRHRTGLTLARRQTMRRSSTRRGTQWELFGVAPQSMRTLPQRRGTEAPRLSVAEAPSMMLAGLGTTNSMEVSMCVGGVEGDPRRDSDPFASFLGVVGGERRHLDVSGSEQGSAEYTFMEPQAPADPLDADGDSDVASYLRDVFVTVDHGRLGHVSWETFTSFLIEGITSGNGAAGHASGGGDANEQSEQQLAYVFRGEVPVFRERIQSSMSHEWIRFMRHYPADNHILCVSRRRVTYIVPGNAKTQSALHLHNSVVDLGGPFITAAEHIPAFQATVVAATDRLSLRVWQHNQTLPPREVLATTFSHGLKVVTSALLWAPERRVLWSATREGHVHASKMEKDGMHARYTIGHAELQSHHEDTVTSLILIPNPERVVSTSLDRTCRVYDPDGLTRVAILRGHRHGVCCAAYSDQNSLLVTAGYDASIFVWADLQWDHPAFTISDQLHPFLGNIVALAAVPSSALVAAADSTGMLKLFDTSNHGVVLWTQNVTDPSNFESGLLRRDTVRCEANVEAGDPMNKGLPTAAPLAGTKSAKNSVASNSGNGAAERLFASMTFTGELSRQFYIGGNRVFAYRLVSETQENPLRTCDLHKTLVAATITDMLGIITVSSAEATLWSLKKGLPDCRQQHLTRSDITRSALAAQTDVHVLGHSSGDVTVHRASTGLLLDRYACHNGPIAAMALHPFLPVLATYSNHDNKLCWWLDEQLLSSSSLPVAQPSSRRITPTQVTSGPSACVAAHFSPDGILFTLCLMRSVFFYTYNDTYKRWLLSCRLEHGADAELQSAMYVPWAVSPAAARRQSEDSLRFSGIGVPSSSTDTKDYLYIVGDNRGRLILWCVHTAVIAASDPNASGSDDEASGADDDMRQQNEGGREQKGSESVRLRVTGAVVHLWSQSSIVDQQRLAAQRKRKYLELSRDLLAAARAEALEAAAMAPTPTTTGEDGDFFARAHAAHSVSPARTPATSGLAGGSRCVTPRTRRAACDTTGADPQLPEGGDAPSSAAQIAAQRKRRHDDERAAIEHQRREQVALLQAGEARAPRAKPTQQQQQQQQRTETPMDQSCADRCHPSLEAALAARAAAGGTSLMAPPLRCLAYDPLYPFLLYSGDDLGRVSVWYVRAVLPPAGTQGRCEEPRRTTHFAARFGRVGAGDGSEFDGVQLPRAHRQRLSIQAPADAYASGEEGAGEAPAPVRDLLRFGSNFFGSPPTRMGSSVNASGVAGLPGQRRRSSAAVHAGAALTRALSRCPPECLRAFACHSEPVTSITCLASPLHCLVTCGADNLVVLSMWNGVALATLQQGPIAERSWQLAALYTAALQHTVSFQATLLWMRLRSFVACGGHRLLMYEGTRQGNTAPPAAFAQGEATPSGGRAALVTVLATTEFAASRRGQPRGSSTRTPPTANFVVQKSSSFKLGASNTLSRIDSSSEAWAGLGGSTGETVQRRAAFPRCLVPLPYVPPDITPGPNVGSTYEMPGSPTAHLPHGARAVSLSKALRDAPPPRVRLVALNLPATLRKKPPTPPPSDDDKDDSREADSGDGDDDESSARKAKREGVSRKTEGGERRGVQFGGVSSQQKPLAKTSVPNQRATGVSRVNVDLAPLPAPNRRSQIPQQQQQQQTPKDANFVTPLVDLRGRLRANEEKRRANTSLGHASASALKVATEGRKRRSRDGDGASSDSGDSRSDDSFHCGDDEDDATLLLRLQEATLFHRTKSPRMEQGRKSPRTVATTERTAIGRPSQAARPLPQLRQQHAPPQGRSRQQQLAASSAPVQERRSTLNFVPDGWLPS